MGRSTPDGPRGFRPPPPPAPPSRKPDFNPPGQGAPPPGGTVAVDPRARRRARCSYCGRGGEVLTQCDGCGATVLEVFTPAPVFPPNRTIRGAAVTAFPMVKR